MHCHDACRLTLTSPWEARIEENTYLAYVFANWADYAVAVCVPITDGDERGEWA
jgi:hypothetical protein